MRITRREKKFWEQHLSCVRHITLDPKGPGVVRLHMIPPRAEGKDEPFLLLLNGAKLIPLNLSWAILLANFMAALESFFTEGDNAPDREVEQADWERLAEEAVTATRSVYPRTKPEQLREDLALLMESLIAIARGQEPPVEVGTLSLGDYAPYMSAPHRMDLMVSAMTQDGAWHCNQKCLHCYAAGQPMGESRELTTAQWKEALERLRHANIPQVTFTGGEPTLRADLVELVEAAQWFVTRLNTNGRLLTPELCRRLYEASLDSVQVTLYSADAAVHNTLVGAPGFDDTVQGIRNAVAAGLMTSVNTPLCSLNRDYAATLRFVHELGVRYVTCSGLIPSGGAETEASQATRLTQEELTAVLRQAVETAEELGMEIDFTQSYDANETFRFAFRWVQEYMYTLSDSGAVSYDYTPGWFKEAPVDVMTLTWHDPASVAGVGSDGQTGGDHVLTASNMEPGDRLNFTVEYASWPSTLYWENSRDNLPDNSRGDDSYDDSDDSDNWVFTVFVIFVLVIFFVVRAAVYDGYAGGFGTRYVFVHGLWYPAGPDGRHPRPGSVGTKHKPAPPRSSGFGGGKRGGGFGGGGFGGGGSHCACASSCACACACAGGGRAGCSAKNLYGAVKLSEELTENL